MTVGPVASGLSHHVVSVDGRVPTSITDFVGVGLAVAVALRLGGGQEQILTGDGALRDGWVRFLQKTGATGRDVRAWAIADDPNLDGFSATSAP